MEKDNGRAVELKRKPADGKHSEHQKQTRKKNMKVEHD